MEELLFELGKISAVRDGRVGRELFPYFHKQKCGGMKVEDEFQKTYLGRLGEEHRL